MESLLLGEGWHLCWTQLLFLQKEEHLWKLAQILKIMNLTTPNLTGEVFKTRSYKKTVLTARQPAKDIFSYVSDGDIEQTLSSINTSCYVSTTSTWIKCSNISVLTLWRRKFINPFQGPEQSILQCYLLTSLKSELLKTTFAKLTQHNCSRTLPPSLVSCLHGIWCFKYNDKKVR